MTALFAALVLVPLADQGVKRFVRRRLGARVAPLGRLASLQVVPGRMWLARARARPGPGTMAGTWLLASATLLYVGVLLPSSGPFAGLLVGGSLSHLLEGARRGTVVDCFCLASRLRFNLADAAMVAGGLGMLAHLPVAAGLAAP
jgi:signal peptidase II